MLEIPAKKVGTEVQSDDKTGHVPLKMIPGEPYLVLYYHCVSQTKLRFYFADFILKSVNSEMN